MTTLQDISTEAYSGDIRVDALLTDGVDWNFLLPQRSVLNYTFNVAQATEGGRGPLTAFNTSQQNAVRAILNYVTTITGVQFAETSSGFAADLHFAACNLSGSTTAGLCSSSYSYSYFGSQVSVYSAEAYVYLDNVEFAAGNGTPAAGSQGFEVLLHEIGHALGLQHPFDGPYTLPAAQDNTNNTVMSYTHAGTNKTSFQAYDLLALQWIYGADGLAGTYGVNSTFGPSLDTVVLPTDDYKADTGTMGQIAVSGSVSGSIETANDRDWFRVNLIAGRSYRFNLDGTSLGDPLLVLLNGSGIVLASNDNANGTTSHSEISYVAPTTAVYYLSAQAAGSGIGAYTLRSIEVITDDYRQDTGTTGRLNINGSVNGNIEVGGDQDWFRVDLVAGRSYRFNLDGATLIDPVLSLLNASGVVLLTNDDVGTTTSNSEIAYTASTSGAYYLSAQGFGSGTGSYSLRVLETTLDDFLANTGTTGRIVANESVSGNIEVTGDNDWFRIDLLAGQAYRFNLDGVSLGNPFLSVLNSSGVELASNDNANAATNNSEVTYTAVSTGSYYLSTRAATTGTGSYTLRAFQIPADDFQGSTNTTGQVSVNGSISGLIETAGDIDWFRVSLLADHSYRFNLNGVSLSDPSLVLRSASGTVLLSNNDADGSLNPEISYTAPAAGTYYLSAQANVSGTGTYVLSSTDATIIAPVYRFAKISNGAYFFTGNESEKNTVVANYPDFRFEGTAFGAFGGTGGAGEKVFRFANVNNGGYFYTGSVAERDLTIQNYSNMRYEGSSFSVAQTGAADAQPVFRLANLNNGAYLYTTSQSEKSAALALGFWRDEGVSFWAPLVSSSHQASAAMIDFASEPAALPDITLTGAGLAASDDIWLS